MGRIGTKRKRVAVQKYTETRGAQGGSLRGFVTENFMWANINPLSASERVEADKTENVRTHRVTMSFYSPGITSADRILFGTRKFGIVSVVNPGERGCDTILDVKELEAS
jgi:SPP1 family predicted phage head-tail adaptor